MNELPHHPLQKRAHNIVKRLGLFTKLRGKPSTTASSIVDFDAKERPQTLPLRETRSMDVLSSKPFVPGSSMLTMDFKSQPLLDRLSLDDSAQSHSQHSHSDDMDLRSSRLKMNGVSDSMKTSASLPPDKLQPAPEAQPARRSVTLNSEAVRQSLSGRGEASNADSSASGGKRPGAPRLKTLPPLNFNLKDGNGGRLPRLSPSVIVRLPPFPILELPALPTPIAEVPGSSLVAPNARRRGQARLNSMPVLSMEGGDEERENDLDHEHYGLDEEDEGDEGDESPDAMAQSDDEDDEVVHPPQRPSAITPKQGSFLGRTRTLTPRFPDLLPRPSFSALLGSSGIGSASSSSANTGNSAASASTEQRHANGVPQPQNEVATPHAVANGTARPDYFSSALATDDRTQATSSSAEARNRSYSASQRTPTASDYASATQTSSEMRDVSSQRDGHDGDMFRYGLTASNAMAVPHLVKADANAPAKLAEKRPSFYHHASKSMVELFSSVTPERGDVKGKGKLKGGADMSVALLSSDPRARAKGEAWDDDRDMSAVNRNIGTPDIAPASPPKASGTTNEPSPLLKRRPSMPMFSEAGPPPPYPSFLLSSPQSPTSPQYHGLHALNFRSASREDEGKEALPPYSNDIYLAAIMPRKMEFTAPGVPARDRKWRRTYCVLEGTMFRVYDAPPRVSGVSALGGWWERKVGVGDITLGVPQSGSVVAGANGTNVVIGRKEPKKRMKWEEEQAVETDCPGADGEAERPSMATVQVDSHQSGFGSHRSKRHLAASLLHPGRALHGHGPSRSADNSRASSPGASPRSSFQFSRPSVDMGSGSSAPSSARPSADFSSSTHASNSSVTAQSASSVSISGTSGVLSTSGSHLSVASAFRRHHGHHGRSESEHLSGMGNAASQSQLSLNSHSDRPSHSHARSQSQPLNQLMRRASSDATKAGALANTAATLPPPSPQDLQRVYTLQRAESGLASDYLKRKNVVRVRMEGEQFLLQCTDVTMVVEWIEGLQAATNIALDLDERPMPKGPIFPRRRRRRRVLVPVDSQTAAATQSSEAASDSANATAES